MFKFIDFDYKVVNRVAYFSYIGSRTVFILFDYFYLKEGIDYIQHMLLKNIQVFDTNEAGAKADLKNVDSIIAFDNENIQFDNNLKVDRIKLESKSLAEYSSYALPHFQKNMVYINKEVERTIIDNVCQYQPEIVKQNDILEAILEIIYYEFEGEKK